MFLFWQYFLDKDSLAKFATLPKEKQEETFIAHAKNGDTSGVEEILKQFENLDKDCTDKKGRTALRMAVRRQHTPVGTANTEEWFRWGRVG